MAETKEVKYGCPWCKSTQGFSQANGIEAETEVNGFAPDGSPDYGGQTNSQRMDPEVPRSYRCKNCSERFEKPFPVTETYPEREMTPAQLRAKFDSLADDSRWGEHHRFKMENWREAVVNGDTRLGYWEWVSHLLEMDI